MKKLIFAVVFFSVAIFCLTSYVDIRNWSPSGRRSKLLNDAIVTKNDSVLFSDFNRVYITKSEPMHFYGIPDHMVNSSMRILNPNGSIFQKLDFNHQVAMKILETKWGVDSVAQYLYNNYNSKNLPVFWEKYYSPWNSLIGNLESKMSPNLLSSVKNLVIQDGLDNAFWLKRYLSNQEIEKIILENEKNNQWTKKWEKWTFLSIFGEPLYSKFLETITDKEIIDFDMINKISIERKSKFLNKLDLHTALKFLDYRNYYHSPLDNEATEARKLLLSRKSEWKKMNLYDLCYYNEIITLELISELRKRPLAELLNVNVDFHNWSVPFYKYAGIILSKVNSKEDYGLARNFFSKYDEGGWLALLGKKMLTI